MLGESGVLKDAYLAGGTAASLHLGHRISHDLDFFTHEEFAEEILVQRLETMGLKTERVAWRTILGDFGSVHFSIFFYKYPLLFPAVPYEGIMLADLRDVAAMKIEALGARGTKRDFIDLYMIIHTFPITLAECMDLYRRKYEPQRDIVAHAIKSLHYFNDAEKQQERPLEMLTDIAWDDVKAFFREETERCGRELLEGNG